MRDLIEKLFFAAFDNPFLAQLGDAAELPPSNNRLACTTDSYVVSPLFFPGGDIGSLSIHGTINDLTMCGARPRFITASFILEEGLAMETLWKVAQSMGDTARRCGVQIVTGDTKVVDRGKGDGIFINTTGIGVIEHNQQIAASSISPGDQILLSGDLGRHGIAVLCTREGLSFEQTIHSDSAPLWPVVSELLQMNIELHCMRDLTRGGLASALVELATSANVSIVIEEEHLRVDEAVQGACELLGLDPIYVANEGRFLLFVPEANAQLALGLLQNHNVNAAIIGRVTDKISGGVTMKRTIGTERIVDMISGEQLPRIC